MPSFAWSISAPRWTSTTKETNKQKFLTFGKCSFGSCHISLATWCGEGCALPTSRRNSLKASISHSFLIVTSAMSNVEVISPWATRALFKAVAVATSRGKNLLTPVKITSRFVNTEPRTGWTLQLVNFPVGNQRLSDTHELAQKHFAEIKLSHLASLSQPLSSFICQPKQKPSCRSWSETFMNLDFSLNKVWSKVWIWIFSEHWIWLPFEKEFFSAARRFVCWEFHDVTNCACTQGKSIMRGMICRPLVWKSFWSTLLRLRIFRKKFQSSVQHVQISLQEEWNLPPQKTQCKIQLSGAAQREQTSDTKTDQHALLFFCKLETWDHHAWGSSLPGEWEIPVICRESHQDCVLIQEIKLSGVAFPFKIKETIASFEMLQIWTAYLHKQQWIASAPRSSSSRSFVSEFPQPFKQCVDICTQEETCMSRLFFANTSFNDRSLRQNSAKHKHVWPMRTTTSQAQISQILFKLLTHQWSAIWDCSLWGIRFAFLKFGWNQANRFELWSLAAGCLLFHFCKSSTTFEFVVEVARPQTD